MIVVFDCETSGFSESRLLQLGVLLVDGDYNVQMQASLLVRPDGWKIEEGAAKVHGISQEKAEKLGLPVDVVLGVLCALVGKADLVVGHNLDFDMGIVGGELRKSRWPEIKKAQECTMRMMTPVCRIPPTEKMKKAGRSGYKSPKLIEAYRYAFGEEFVGAHDALADCVATLRVWRWLKEGAKPVVPVQPDNGYFPVHIDRLGVVCGEPVPLSLVSSYAPPAPLPTNI